MSTADPDGRMLQAAKAAHESLDRFLNEFIAELSEATDVVATESLTLTDFLRARLDEDYEAAYGAAPSPWTEGGWDGEFEGPREVLDKHGDVTARCYYGGTYGHVMHFEPTRVLRDIEAKRWIMEFVAEFPADVAGHDITRVLAATYADHPDYREEWRPGSSPEWQPRASRAERAAQPAAPQSVGRRSWLYRLFCSHNGTEMWRESETSPAGVYTTRTVRHVCTRCGKDMM